MVHATLLYAIGGTYVESLERMGWQSSNTIEDTKMIEYIFLNLAFFIWIWYNDNVRSMNASTYVADGMSGMMGVWAVAKGFFYDGPFLALDDPVDE